MPVEKEVGSKKKLLLSVQIWWSAFGSILANI